MDPREWHLCLQSDQQRGRRLQWTVRGRDTARERSVCLAQQPRVGPHHAAAAARTETPSEGVLLNVASLAAYFPMPFMPVYAPSKAFILSFSLALREELRGSLASVSALCPNGSRTSQACREKIERAGILGKVTRMDADQVGGVCHSQDAGGGCSDRPGLGQRMIVVADRLPPRRIVYGIVSRFWARSARALARDADVAHGPASSTGVYV